MKSQIKIVLTACCAVALHQTFAQNLVKNGDFEELVACPKAVSQLSQNARDLSSPTKGTTDIFSTCATGKVAIPENFRGIQEPHNGNSYAGLYLYSSNNYREYIQLPLQQTLQKGKYYKFSFFVSLAESSTVSTTSLDALFTKVPIRIETSKNLSKSRLLEHNNNNAYNFKKLSWRGKSNEVEGWVEVRVIFRAKGFEKNIIIGNFTDDKATSKKNLGNTPSLEEFAYYYLDGASLVEDQDTSYKKGEPLVINGVQFNTDSYELTTSSKLKLKELYRKLKTIPNIKLTINGHTDDKGTKGRNELLSHQRAGSVASYLVALGFPKDRIIWKGHGNRKPLIEEMTEEARLQNRRVDFVITDFEDDD